MKKLISFALALAMIFSMVACGCDHQWQDATCEAPKTCTKCGEVEGEAAGHIPGTLTVSAVDTDALTITHTLPCSLCGEVIETKESATGIAPVDSVMHVSPDEWYNCLTTNIQLLGAGQTLIPYPTESEDGTLIHAVVSMSQMMTVFTFNDLEGTAIPTDRREERGLIHNIRVDGQFTNDNAKEFFMLLMIILINNNSALEFDDANTLTAQIMSGNPVSDNGYTYAMEIISAEDHTVCVSITAE